MISYRAKEIPPFLVMDILEQAQDMERQGIDIVHLEVGEPDFDTPVKIRQAAQAAMESGETHYTHSLGFLPLREAIAGHYRKRYKVNVSSDQVIVTMGTSPALHLILSLLLNSGDEVILSDPAYACYPNFIRFVGGSPVTIPVYAESNFELNANMVKSKFSLKTKALLINSPSNPTGTLLSAQNLQDLAKLDVPIISDEIYHGLVYKEKEHSILEFTHKAFVINGFSKYYAMTGWRLGYIIAPQSYVRPLQKIQQNLYICASSFVQRAGVSALTEEHPELDEMVKTYNRRRIYLIDALKKLGFGVKHDPKGAFYVLADASNFTNNSYEFCLKLLNKAHVATTAGIDFGKNAEGYIRFSYANNIENIKTGMSRLESFLK